MSARRGGRAALLLLVAAASSVSLLGAQVATAAPSAGPSPSATASPAPVPSASARKATGPTAVDDAATVGVAGSVRLAGATNDRAGSAAIKPALTVFPTTGQPKGSVVDQGGLRLQVVDHGTFVVNPVDGSVTFTSWTKRSGAVAVDYRITDANGATDVGLLSVVVTAGGGSDLVTGYVDSVLVGVDLLANDTPGRNADGTPGTLDATSVRFAASQREAGVTVSPDGRTLTDLGVGILTFDANGLLTFHATSASSKTGRPSDLFYTAQDTTVTASGAPEHHSYLSLVEVVAYPAQVLATSDGVATPFAASITLPGILNDRDSNPTFLLLPGLSVFDQTVVAPGGYLSPDRRKIRLRGHGTWTINSDGSVLYVPPRGFNGRDDVDMLVFDDHGNQGEERLFVDVRSGPSAAPDTTTLAQNVTASIAVLANDVPGKQADGHSGAMDATYVRFPTDGQPAGATVSAYQRTLSVPGQGVYTADRTTGAIAFDPEPGFVGQATPITFSAQDTVKRTDGRVVHNPVTSTLSVTVTAISPTALNNWTSTTVGTPVNIPVLGNDKAGAASAPLVPSSLRLRLAPGLPPGSSLSGDAKTLTVAGEGRFVAHADGVVVFAPVAGFVGRVATVGYQVSDANGTSVRATITVQVNVA